MAEAQDGKNDSCTAGESTPLLAKTSEGDGDGGQHADLDEESGYLGAPAGAAAPPPSAAPPPPPPTAGDTCDVKKEGVRRASSGASLSSANAGERAGSPSQLSTTQSNKSGKSGKSKKRKKKGDRVDASSTRSGRSGKSKRKKKEDVGPQKSICHLLFDAVRYMAILASCMMFAMQIVPLVVLGHESTWLQISVRCYLAIFCLSFIITELRIPFLRNVEFLQNSWVLRGFLYSFIGLIGMEQDLAVKVSEIARATTSSVLGPDYGTLFATLFMSITTWLMIGVGILYTALGLLCMQRWYERLEKGHTEKVKEWKRKKRQEEDFKRQQNEYKEYERDRREGRGEWYDDLE